MDAAAKKRDAALSDIDQKRSDVSTEAASEQMRLTAAHHNCPSCCMGPDGHPRPDCTLPPQVAPANPTGLGSCDNNFQNILHGY